MTARGWWELNGEEQHESGASFWGEQNTLELHYVDVLTALWSRLKLYFGGLDFVAHELYLHRAVKKSF